MSKRLTVVFLSVLLFGCLAGCQSKPETNQTGAEMTPENALRALEKMGVPFSESTFLRLITAAQTERNGQLAVAFLQAGINVNTADRWGTTALMYAAGAGNDPVLSMLLPRGADVHAKNDDGETALHFAARSKSNSAPFMLLEKGADVNAADVCGTTPLDVAERTSNLRMVMGLEQQGARRGKNVPPSTLRELTPELVGESLKRNDLCEAQRALGAMRRIGGPDRHYQVGIRYLNGESGFPNNPNEAIKWLQSAAEAGHPQARETLLRVAPGSQPTK